MARRVGVLRGPRKTAEPVALGIIILIAAPTVLGAQLSPAQPASELGLHFDLGAPLYSTVSYNAVEAVGALRVPLNEGVTALTGVSIIYAKDSGLDPSVAISNVYATFVLGGDRGFATITLTLPTTGRFTQSNYAPEAGLRADIAHPERYQPTGVSIAASGTRRWTLDNGSRVGVQGGVAIVTPVNRSSDFYFRYGGFGETELGSARVGGDLTGAYFFGGIGENFGQKSVHHIGLFAGLPGTSSSPTLFARIPLDNDARAELDAMIGARVSFWPF